VTNAAGAIWQDDGKTLRFITPELTPAVHSFDMSNIVRDTFSFSGIDLRDRPNRLQAKFRNLDDPYLLEVSTQTDRTDLQERAGIIDPGVQTWPAMTYSQAQRLLERQMRLASDYNVTAQFRGQGNSLHVLPGDYVTVTHPIAQWQDVNCIVLQATDESAEKAADERAYTVQRIDGPIYLDTDHRPTQPAITP
jgi:hypothetical protein